MDEIAMIFSKPKTVILSKALTTMIFYAVQEGMNIATKQVYEGTVSPEITDLFKACDTNRPLRLVLEYGNSKVEVDGVKKAYQGGVFAGLSWNATLLADDNILQHDVFISAFGDLIILCNVTPVADITPK